MNERLQQNLQAARTHLLNTQMRLAFARQGVIDLCVSDAEHNFCRAIDRAWEAQCMASGSY